MPPLPTLWDPAGAVDKLPQPFRMIDKILADIVEQVVDMIGTRESQRRAEDASRVDLTFAPHAVMEVAPETCCFLPIGIAGIAAVAMPDGEVQVRSARDPSICFSDRTHTSPVTAMEAGMAVCTSGRLLAAASRTALTLHEVDIKTCEISLLATVPLPADPDDTSPPVRLHWSDNLGHLAVCRRSGALALFTLSLPPPNVSLESVGAFVALSLKAFGETRVEELLRVPAATVRAFCLGSAAVGPSNLVWQLQQRPDKSPHSDRYHKSARGAYVWWEGANRLLLLDFEAAAGAAAAAGGAGGAVVPPPEVEAAVKAGAAGTSKPSTPATKAASSKSVAPPGEASSLLTASASAAAAAYAGPERPPEVPQIAPMARDWLLPHDVTAAATTSDHKTMAWGLADGSVVIWDDRSCCSTKVLPRLKGGITALSWVNGVAHKLVCASAGGHIFIADVIKPEDSSQKPYEFPQAIHEVHTLPNEPFALCICRGHTSSDGEIASTHRGGRGGPSILSTMSGHGPGGGGHDVMRVPPQRPRVFWYNVLEEKPVAELMGPRAEQGFGLACCVPPPPSLAPPPPRPDTAATDAGAADGKSAAASDAAAAGTDMLELVATARELFTRNVDSGSGGGGAGGGGGGGGGVGPLPPLPRELREALYGHRWDRVIVDVRRTHTPVRGRGKREEYTAMVATGNMRGVFGLGIGVAESAQLATARAHLDSLSRLAAVPLYRGHTLYTHVDHTFHRLSIRMMPRPAGWGLRCPDLLYELCGLVGLRDVSIRVRGQRGSRFFVAQCFQEALQKQTTPHDGVEATGMYIREVFRGGPGGRLPCGLRRGVDVM